jgi:hypothetical protein
MCIGEGCEGSVGEERLWLTIFIPALDAEESFNLRLAKIQSNITMNHEGAAVQEVVISS